MQILESDPRQDLILKEFIDQGKWKNALDHCEKRLKKLKKPDKRLELNYLLIELNSQMVAKPLSQEELLRTLTKHTALLDFLETCDDLDFIEHIEQNFGNVSGEMWKRASKSRSTEEDFYEIWFDAKFSRRQFHLAAEACMHWRLRFPSKNSELTMKMALCYHLAAQRPGSLDKPTAQEVEQCDKYAKMAVHLLRQTAKNTPSDNSKEAVLRNNVDLELLVDVFRSNDLGSEAIDILYDDRKGLRSPLGSWDLAIALMALLRTAKRYEELSQFCRAVLQDTKDFFASSKSNVRWGFGEAGDDSLVFDAMIEVCRNLAVEAMFVETLELFNNIASLGSFNAQLAIVQLHQRCGSASDNLEAAQAFFRQYQSRHQVAEVIPYLRQEIHSDFVAFIKPLNDRQEALHEPFNPKSWREKVILKMNCLKFTYELMHKTGQLPKPPGKPFFGLTPSDLVTLVNDCITTYMCANAAEQDKPKAENGIADIALIVAARVLVSTLSTRQIHQARLLLEYLLSYSRYDYDALILLVRICLYQGAVTKAFKYYRRLEIKNLQQLNESAILFDQISTLHPHASPADKLDPISNLESMVNWAKKRKDSLELQSLRCLENQNWMGAYNSREFAAEWNKSFGYVTILSEMARIGIRSPSDPALWAAGTFSKLLTNMSTADGRVDFMSMPPRHPLSLDTTPEQMLLVDQIHPQVSTKLWRSALVFNSLAIMRDTVTSGEERRLYASLYPGDSVKRVLGEFEPGILVSILKCSLESGPKKALSEAAVQRLQRTIQTGLNFSGDQVRRAGKSDQKDGALGAFPSAYAFRAYHYALEFLQLASEATKWLGTRHSIPADLKSTVDTAVSEQRRSITEWSKEAGERINSNVAAQTDAIVAGSVGNCINALIGRQRIEKMMGQHGQSVIDTILGLSR